MRASRLIFTPFQIFLLVLATIIFFGVIAGVIVLTQGLWVTNLTDLVPWGLWITIDLSAIALSAGAFLLCAAVYILGLKKYQPLARIAFGTHWFIGTLTQGYGKSPCASCSISQC